PHYRLRALHDLLMAYPEYREQALVVEGYFLPAKPPPRNPTVVEVLGPDYARRYEEVYIDNDVLEAERVEDKEEILRQGEAEKEKHRVALSRREREAAVSHAE